MNNKWIFLHQGDTQYSFKANKIEVIISYTEENSNKGSIILYKGFDRVHVDETAEEIHSLLNKTLGYN